jgi:hypothetical protein
LSKFYEKQGEKYQGLQSVSLDGQQVKVQQQKWRQTTPILLEPIETDSDYEVE